MHQYTCENRTVTPTATTTAALERGPTCAAELAGHQPGSPISRDLALRLIRCDDDDLPALLASAGAAKSLAKPAD